MKNKTLFSFLAVLLLVFLFPTAAFANSSWHWISSTRPFDLLPIVITATLLTEILSIYYIAKVKSLKIIIPVVTLANLTSFLIPYIWLGLNPDNVYSLYTSEEGLLYAINYTVQSSPTFTISILYLLITLFAETPIVYFFLRKRAANKKILFIVIIAANILTTAVTFAAERIFCHGEW